MPDGSALMGEPVWLNDDKGRCGKFIINPWSGLPIFERLGELAEKAQQSTAEKAGKLSDKTSPDDRSTETFESPSSATALESNSGSSSEAPPYDDEFGLGD